LKRYNEPRRSKSARASQSSCDKHGGGNYDRTAAFEGPSAINHLKGFTVASNQKKFLVMYLIPASVMQEWLQTEASAKKAAEEKMKGEWNQWMSAHSAMILSTDAAGKTERITSDGVSDTKNDIMLYSIIEAESHEAAAKSFENHPHLQIPQSSIEVMEIQPMAGM
jgi:hypothetical protein